jgi:hypothetical protein
MSVEDRFLARLARGALISQDEYDQISEDLPPEILAGALASRFNYTNETRTLVEAARLYLRAGFDCEALEVCSRAVRINELQRIVEKILPRLRRAYPDTRLYGKLLEDAFLVIDLHTGHMDRFPPLMPATGPDTPA